MAAKYTQDQFLKAVEDSGTRSQWSDSDWMNALDDPTWGMSILSGKIAYGKAETDEERAAAHQWNEDNRRMKGYSGGGDGSYYHMIPTPAAYTYEDAPTFQESYNNEVQDAYNAAKNYGDFNYADYISRYDPRIQSKTDQILNRADFAYDPATDPLYSQYRKQYIREGRRATEDTMAAAAAMSGGLPSSYAATAAGQQGNYYASQLTDKIPELYQLAYNRYLAEDQLNRSDLSMLQGLEQTDYNRYVNDRDFAYNVYGDKYNRLLNTLNAAQGMQSDAWNRYRDQMGWWENQQQFGYNQWLDELDNQRQAQQDAWDRAFAAAGEGDYSLLAALGVDTSRNPYDYQREQDALDRERQERLDALDRAETGAYWGDYTGLNEAGINPNLSNINDRTLAESGQYNNIGEDKIMQLQNFLGITVDGWWGPESIEASGGLTAEEAYQAMKNGTLQRGSGSGSGGGGGDYYDGGGSGGGEDYAAYIPTPTATPLAGDPNQTPTATTLPYTGGTPTVSTLPSTRDPDFTTLPNTTGDSGKSTADSGSSGNGKANRTDMQAISTEVAKRRLSGADEEETTQMIKDAVNEGLISKEQANAMAAPGKKIYKTTK